MIEKLILGTVQFGLEYGINNRTGKPPLTEVQKILAVAREAGIKTLDAADAYGDSQQVLAQTDLKNFKIQSKFIFKDNQLDIEPYLKQTLETLKLDWIESYSFHKFPDLKKYAEKNSWREVMALKERGLIRKLGASVYSNDEILFAARLPWIDVIQLPFNLLDNVHLRGAALKTAKAAGKTLHVRSIFLQGLFFKPIEEFTGRFAPLKPYVQELQALALVTGNSLEQLCLAYPLLQPEIDGVIFGVDSVDQLSRNLDNWSKITLDPTVFAKLRAVDQDTRHLLQPSSWKTI